MSTVQQRAVLAQSFGCLIDMHLISAFCSATSQLLKPTQSNGNLPTLEFFIAKIAVESQIGPVVLYIALYYVLMLRKTLSIIKLDGTPCSAHRIALTAIIVAEKYICDIALKNSVWQSHARLFRLEEINLMERQFLQLLEYRLEVNPDLLYGLVLSLNASNHVRQTTLFTQSPVLTQPVPHYVAQPASSLAKMKAPAKHTQPLVRFGNSSRYNPYLKESTEQTDQKKENLSKEVIVQDL